MDDVAIMSVEYVAADASIYELLCHIIRAAVDHKILFNLIVGSQ